MNSSATISAVLIVKNEAESLSSCLESVKWCDEIVIVDSGSTDNTLAIAQDYTDKVYTESDWQGFGKQRQRAQSYATSDWIFMIDADERMTPELASSIRGVIREDQQSAVYAVPRLSWVFGRFIRHCGWYPDYVIRLYPATKGQYSDDMVHEKVQFAKDIELKHLQGDLLHYTYKDLQDYITKSGVYAAAWAMQRKESGKSASIFQGVLHGIACFLRMYVVHAGFLDGRQGFLLSVLSAHSTFVKYADLWVRSQSEK